MSLCVLRSCALFFNVQRRIANDISRAGRLLFVNGCWNIRARIRLKAKWGECILSYGWVVCYHCSTANQHFHRVVTCAAKQCSGLERILQMDGSSSISSSSSSSSSCSIIITDVLSCSAERLYIVGSSLVEVAKCGCTWFRNVFPPRKVGS